MDIETIFEETDFPMNDEILASADFGDLSTELDEPFDGILRGTFSCNKCDQTLTHRRSFKRHQISIHATSASFQCEICRKRFNRKDNFLRHSKSHKLMTEISMEVSQAANDKENSSMNVIQPSRAIPGPSTITEPSALSNNGVTSVSSTSAAPSRKRKISSVNRRTKNACLDTFEVHKFFPNPLTSKDLTVSLHSLKTEITDKIKEIASSKKGLKWYLNSCVRFIRKITTEDFETCTSYCRLKCAVTLDQESPDIETSIAKVIASSIEFENRGSGWEFQKVLKNELKTAVYKPLAAASYITLPPKLRTKKAILNIQNEDQQCFLCSLINEPINDDEYAHCINVWETFNLKNVGEYHDLYVTSDVILLADVFQNFRQLCLNFYKLDPCHCYTAPGLAWQACLYMSRVKLELFTDLDMHLFIERGIRGGISMISHRFNSANNKYLESYDEVKPSKYILYLDANNLYGWAMSQFLPTHGFEWIKEPVNFMEISDESDIGFILEVDLDYPENLHDLHNDYPLAPETLNVTNDMLSPYCKEIAEKYNLNINSCTKLVPNLMSK
ncbi:c2H2-type domain-containing protein [Nephila pilipes]|uniref:C2H2-type domain-containing protein n=1 Tax=Nephila pilipes TaxID=299642 RepID=A0A8X6UGE2_NEPPI|nr:c2H2-type domain-containing protein [Nephila pilipes]